MAASLGRSLASVTCCQELQPAALTRALRAAAASGSWLLLEGVEQLRAAALELLAGHLSALRDAASEEGVEGVLTLEGAFLAALPCCLLPPSARQTGGAGWRACWMPLLARKSILTSPGSPPVQM
jgi:hypothetical protein